MKIYFDSKDLINVIEHSNPFSYGHFKSILDTNNHEVVLSSAIIAEISFPLFDTKTKSNVMIFLNKLDELPHIFIHTVKIGKLELMEAISSFQTTKEYEKVDPFVLRYDDTLEKNGMPPTKQIINYSLSQIVWDLYQENADLGYYSYSTNFKNRIDAERKIKVDLKQKYCNKIKKDLKLYKIDIPKKLNISDFFNWLYRNPNICPGTRIEFEIFHKIVQNLNYNPRISDIADLIHLQCLPYVDFLFTDRRTYEYLCQAAKSINLDYETKTFRSIKEILD